MSNQSNVVNRGKTISPDRIFRRNLWFFTLPAIGIGVGYQLVSNFFFTYVQFGFALTVVQFTTLSLIIGVGGRIWDAVNDPIMGAIIDGTHLKIGKFRPWIILGVITCGISMIIMFNMQALAGWAFIAFLCIMYFIWEATCTMVDISYWAMLPSLTSEKKRRNRLTSLTVIFAAMCGLIVQTVVTQTTVGDVRAGYANVSIVLSVFSVVCALALFLGVKETPRSESSKNEKISIKKMFQTIIRNDQVLWMALSFVFYAVGASLVLALTANLIYMEISYSGTAFLLVILVYSFANMGISAIYPMFANKLTRKQLLVIGLLVASIGYTIFLLMGWTSVFPSSIAAICVSCALVAIGQGIFYLTTLVNLSNCIEYNEYKHGERKEAVLSTVRAFIWKLSTAITAVIMTMVLAISGVYGLSKSISTLETQKNYFDKIQDVQLQSDYIENIQFYIKKIAFESEGTSAYEEAVNRVSEEIKADKQMSKYQLEAQYISAVADAMLVSSSTDGMKTELGRLRDVDTALLSSDEKYFIEISNLKSGNESAANLNFRDKRTLSMRVWLRAVSTGLPIILLFIAWIIQRKKFIIDEQYYEMMMNEIKSRK